MSATLFSPPVIRDRNLPVTPQYSDQPRVPSPAPARGGAR